MTKKALIKLKTKPKRPKRKKLKLEVAFNDGDTLSQALESLGNPDPSDCYIRREWGYDEYAEVYLCMDRMQTEEEYVADLADYQERHMDYEEWYKKNEETILAEVQRRKDASAEKQRRFMEKEQKRLKKELNSLDRRLRK